MLIATERKLTRPRLLRLLDKLEKTPGTSMTIYLPHGSLMADVEKALSNMPDADGSLVLEIIERVNKSTTGAVLFWGDSYKYLVFPPFPNKERPVFYGYEVEILRSLLQHDFTIALILIRLGAYAIGVFQGGKLLSSKVGTGNIHQRHKKGGSSARRFERHREKQMEYFFERVCVRVREKLEPYLERLDYIYYGGERNTINSFCRRCSYMAALEDRTLKMLLNVREPRQATLEAAIEDVWTSKVVQWNTG
ncbi:Vms1/Ankzf1 family peptidyl-tRNA hydrolase [Chloroflexota bacterium]